MFEAFLDTLLRVAELTVLIALPFWLRLVGAEMMHRRDRIGYFQVPGLARLSFLSGALFGGVLLYVNHDGSLYNFDTVFARGGPWDMSFARFFVTWLNPVRYSPFTLYHRVEALDVHDTVTAFTLTSFGLAAAVVVFAIRYFRGRFHLALLPSLAVWLWSAALVIYLVCASAWALNVLNFWAVVLLFLLVRHRSLTGH